MSKVVLVAGARGGVGRHVVGNKKPLRFVVVLLIVVLLGACSLYAKTVVLSEESAGQMVEMNPGDGLMIVLEGNPTTGYGWEVGAVDASILKPVGEPAYKSESNIPGSGGEFSFRFEAVAPGQTELQLVYRRPFEEGVPPVETFGVKVVVDRGKK